MLLLALLGLGCASPPEPVPAPPVPELADPSLKAPATTELPPQHPGFAVEVRPEGMSKLYRGFVRDPQARTALTLALGPLLKEDRVTLLAYWDEKIVTGGFRLLLTAREPAVADLGRKLQRTGRWDPSSLDPLLAAVGAYRAELGARLDLRFLSFGIEVAIQDPQTLRFCWVRGMGNDPQGTLMDRCVLCSQPRGPALALCGERGGALQGPEAARSQLMRAVNPR